MVGYFIACPFIENVSNSKKTLNFIVVRRNAVKSERVASSRRSQRFENSDFHNDQLMQIVEDDEDLPDEFTDKLNKPLGMCFFFSFVETDICWISIYWFKINIFRLYRTSAR